MSKSSVTKPAVHQKPFRCTNELEIRLTKTKGALMVKTGQRISDNQFLIRLIELGLDRLTETMGLEKN